MSLDGVFGEGSANAVAEPDAFQTGLHPFGHIDHGVALVLDVVRELGRAFEDVGPCNPLYVRQRCSRIDYPASAGP